MASFQYFKAKPAPRMAFTAEWSGALCVQTEQTVQVRWASPVCAQVDRVSEFSHAAADYVCAQEPEVEFALGPDFVCLPVPTISVTRSVYELETEVQVVYTFHASNATGEALTINTRHYLDGDPNPNTTPVNFPADALEAVYGPLTYPRKIAAYTRGVGIEPGVGYAVANPDAGEGLKSVQFTVNPRT